MAARRNISPEKLDQIISLRLAGVPVRDVARRVSVAPRTVQDRYQEYLRSVSEERQGMLEEERTEAIARIERVAAAAWSAWEMSSAIGQPDPRFLAEHRQALSQAEKLRGLAVIKTEVSGPNGGPVLVEDAKARLLERLQQLGG
jgi:hypothetical protein